MQADGPRGCRFAGQWFPESQSWHPSVPPFGEMSCITCRCGVSGECALCEVGIGGLAQNGETFPGRAGSWERASLKGLKTAVSLCLWVPSKSALSCTRQGCPTVSGMTVHCHCPAAQGRRVAAAPTVHLGGVSEGAVGGCLGREGSTRCLPGAMPSASRVPFHSTT